MALVISIYTIVKLFDWERHQHINHIIIDLLTSMDFYIILLTTLTGGHTINSSINSMAKCLIKAFPCLVAEYRQHYKMLHIAKRRLISICFTPWSLYELTEDLYKWLSSQSWRWMADVSLVTLLMIIQDCCLQAKSRYLHQYWPSSLTPYDVTWPTV